MKMSSKMNTDLFIQKMREMRDAQKNYFRTRHPGYLDLSRELEKEVDKMLSETQKNLFENGNN